jgi:hypothetical protein
MRYFVVGLTVRQTEELRKGIQTRMKKASVVAMKRVVEQRDWCSGTRDGMLLGFKFCSKHVFEILKNSDKKFHAHVSTFYVHRNLSYRKII